MQYSTFILNFVTATVLHSSLATAAHPHPNAHTTPAPILVRADTLDADSCPGVLAVGMDSISRCCVGGTLPPVQPSSCAGWPMCTGPVTFSPSVGPVSCATILSVSDSDYKSEVSGASESLAKSGTHFATALGTGQMAVYVQGSEPTGSGPVASQTDSQAASKTSGGASGSGQPGITVSGTSQATNAADTLGAGMGVGAAAALVGAAAALVGAAAALVGAAAALVGAAAALVGAAAAML